MQAANGTNTETDREMVQQEVSQLFTETDRIADATTFNGHIIFGGSEGPVSSQNSISVGNSSAHAILNVQGGAEAAGIGSSRAQNTSKIVIEGGVITATGGQYGAGIGGSGGGGSASNITIRGGQITATGGQNAAGIGGGSDYYNTKGDGTDITITGGIVTASGGSSGAGIGGGIAGNGGDIVIKGGNVTAIGGLVQKILEAAVTNRVVVTWYSGWVVLSRKAA